MGALTAGKHASGVARLVARPDHRAIQLYCGRRAAGHVEQEEDHLDAQLSVRRATEVVRLLQVRAVPPKALRAEYHAKLATVSGGLVVGAFPPAGARRPLVLHDRSPERRRRWPRGDRGTRGCRRGCNRG